MNQETISRELSTLLAYMESLITEGFPTLTLTPEYLVVAILQKRDCMAHKVLSDIIPNNTLSKIHKAFSASVENKALKAIRPNTAPKYNEALERVFTVAQEKEFSVLGGERLNSLHILLSLCSDEVDEPTIRNVFKMAGASYPIVLEQAKSLMIEVNSADGDEWVTPVEITENTAIAEDNYTPKAQDIMSLPQTSKSPQKQGILESLCTNINALVEKGEIDRFTGRKNEMQKIINVLGRKKKNNVIIVGGDGVGKTAICEGLASMIVHGEAPQFLANKIIWSLNFAALVAGTQFRGVLEGKVLDLINALKSNKNNILFIDDISSAFSEKKGGDIDLPSLFNAPLAGGEIQIIGTCGYKGYRNTFDNNPSLARRFQKIILEETTEDETLEILRNLQEGYEAYHNVTYIPEALNACISLAKKYIPERHLPDSAIDIFDECGSEQAVKCNDNETTYQLRKEVYEKEQEIKQLKENDEYDKVEQYTDELGKTKSKLYAELRKIKDKKEATLITADMVSDLVSRKTGIPISKLSGDEKKNIVSINDTLKRSIIGQDEAVDTVCRAIKRNRVGLGRRKTMGAFLMIGKTGVGKSLLAKQLATEIFGSEKYLVRIDMSEYEDKTSANKLIGSSAGYVGYENGGVLTEAVKNKKYCVLLLDEFEKASQEVYNLFLQVFDEGFLSDNTGQRIDFKNIIVILTSNVGAKTATDFGRGVGYETEDKTRKIFEKELKKKFSPEFLNRLDDIVYFNTLTTENMHEIIELELKKLNARLETMGHYLVYSRDLITYINDSIEERDYGARPILRVIQDKIENPITDLLLANDYENHAFLITFTPEGELNIT